MEIAGFVGWTGLMLFRSPCGCFGYRSVTGRRKRQLAQVRVATAEMAVLDVSPSPTYSLGPLYLLSILGSPGLKGE